MEPSFLVSSNQIAPSVGALPFCIWYKSNLLQKPKCSWNPRLSACGGYLEKTVFLGESLILQGKNEYCGNLRRSHVPILPVKAAAVKRRKELPFDNVIQRDKKLKLVLKIRRILMSHPNRVMQLRDLGKFRRVLGLEKRRRFIALLRNFPAVFEIVEDGVYSLKFKLTPEAERLYLEEMKIKNEMEELQIVKLRKMLMMSAEKRILVNKLCHLQTDFGLPLDFKDTFCRRYPQYFKVVSTGSGPALELTHWDPELAVSAAELAEEDNRERQLEERNLIIDRPLKFNRVKLPKGLHLSKGEMRRISQFRDIPYISPYCDFSSLRSGTIEKEKHACGVVHEILSLTLEKRTLVDHLTHFRDDFRFSQQIRGMLIRHPDLFYVSFKGDRDSVFLREAYHDSQLIEKDRLLLIKEKLRSLVNVPRRRGVQKNDPSGEEGSEPEGGSGMEEKDEWPDIDDAAADQFDEGDGEDDVDFDDIWSDEEDDLPPDFNGDDGIMNLEPHKPSSKIDDSDEDDEKILDPVFPHGQPRDRW